MHMTLQLLPRRGIGSARVLAVASLFFLPADGHSQVPESSNDPISAFKNMFSGPCGKYFGIDSCSDDSFKGIVTEVSDPERLTIRLASNKTVRVRLAGVNVPTEMAEDARQLLSSQVLTQQVEVVIFCGSQSPKGQLVGRVRGGGTEVNFELIRQGFAYVTGLSEGLDSFTRCVYGQAQEKAKAEKRGFWNNHTDEALE
jgi:endonuclease YncB( thermonuclease family)